MRDRWRTEIWTASEIVAALRDRDGSHRIEIPRFQRRLVWDAGQRSALIDSLKAGFPFGSLLLFEKSRSVFQLVDGLQRASTLVSFLEAPETFVRTPDVSPFLRRLRALSGGPAGNLNHASNVAADWINTSGGLSESNGCSAFRLALHLRERCDLGEEVEEIVSELEPLLTELRKSLEVGDLPVPVIIYHGSACDLPAIFERINTQGTQLTKYQIFAAAWEAYPTVEIPDGRVGEHIGRRFDDLESSGFEVADTGVESGRCSVFEYVDAFGKVLLAHLPEVFGHVASESTGFNLLAGCLNVDTRSMQGLPECILTLDADDELARFQSAVLEAAKDVWEAIEPIAGLRANRTPGRIIRPCHSEYQIISLAAKVFRLRAAGQWENADAFLRRIPEIYLFDILRSYWRGTGDSKLREAVEDGSRYEHDIGKDEWCRTLASWHENQLQRNDVRRVRPKRSQILFLKYIYARKLTRYEDAGPVPFEVDHIVPVVLLREAVKAAGARGIPISPVSNLCLLRRHVNRSKGKDTLFNYLDRKARPADSKREEVGNDVLVRPGELLFVNEYLVGGKKQPNRFLVAYLEFLSQRFDRMKNEFVELNKIRPVKRNLTLFDQASTAVHDTRFVAGEAATAAAIH